MTKGPLIIVSGPSGSGKSTVIARVLADFAGSKHGLRCSVSATTRAPRAGEVDGRQYHFWTRARFEKAIADEAFVEWALVHGDYYGTLKAEVEPYREQGVGVILDIDVNGAAQVRRAYPEAISVFLRTGCRETYERRLRQRGTETEQAIRRRLARAESELARAGEYDYQVVNDDLETAVAQVAAIVRRPFEWE